MYTHVIKPLLFKFNPEKAHKITFKLLKLFQSTPGALALYEFLRGSYNNPKDILGLHFSNSVGLAAGLDKNAELLRVWKGLGFGFAEIGTVTPLAQLGNPKPRLFRLPKDEALINRMGFNNQGVEIIANRLRNRPKEYVIGGNIGKNTATPNEDAIADYLTVCKGLYDYVDYLVINVSCPNISNLSKLQDKDKLGEIIKAITEYRNNSIVYRPILLKVSPDLNTSQLDDSLQLVSDYEINGIIATNTTSLRSNLLTSSHTINNIGKGGLSGKPLAKGSTNFVKHIRKYMPREFPIIASGGILDVDSAKEKLDAGADLLQLYSGFIYNGVGLIKSVLHM